MRKLLIILFVFVTSFAYSQPAGYVAGTFVNWNRGGRDHGYGKSDRYDAVPDSLRRTVFHWCGIGEVNFGNAYDQAPGKFLNDAGTNWNMKVVRGNGDTVQFQIFTFFNYGGNYFPPHVEDVEYFMANTVNMPDTSHHERYWATGFSFGPGLMWGTFLESNFDYEQIFGGTRSISPTFIGGITAVSAGKRNDVWRDSLDNNVGTPVGAADDLYANLGGYKSIHKPNVGPAGHSADSALSIYGTGTASLTDSSKSIWRLMAEWNTNGQPNQLPIANAGTDQSINLPSNSVTLNGSSSTDPDGSIVSYAWSKISGPATYTITSPSSVSTTITGMVQGVYVFRLTVTDDSSAVDTDDVQVVVSPAYVARQRIYLTKEAPFSLRGPGTGVVPENLVDGDTTNHYTVSYDAENVFKPFWTNFILDTTVTNFIIRMRFGGGTANTDFKFYNENFTDSTTINFVNSGNNNWQYLDTIASKSIAFPIRSFIMITQNANNDFQELEFYGNSTHATPTQYFPEYNYVMNDTVKNVLAINNNGNEPAAMMDTMVDVLINGTSAWYTDTAISGVTLGNHRFHFNLFGNNVAGEYSAMASRGMKLYTYIAQASAANFREGPKAPFTGGGDKYSYYNTGQGTGGDRKNIPLTANALNPASWVDGSRQATAYAIYYGNNPSASTAGITVTFSGGASPTVGQNLLQGISIYNEGDAKWVDTARYTEPQAQVAMLGNAWDSIKSRVPSFKLICGALSYPHTHVFKSEGYWSMRTRGFNNFPADGTNINWYSTSTVGQGGGGHGVSPEEDSLYYRMSSWVDAKSRYIGNKKFFIQEFGWDGSPFSGYSAATIAGSTTRETAADWLLRYVMWARSAKVDVISWFRSFDLTNNQNDAGSFVTSGVATDFNGTHPDSSFKYWPAGYAMSTLYNVSSKHIGTPTIIVNGGKTSYTIWKDTAVAGYYDTTTYYVSMGTSSAATQAFTINAPPGKTFSYVQKVEMYYSNGIMGLGTGSHTGTRTVLSPGSSISGIAKERMQIFRVVEQSTGAPPEEPSIRRKKSGKPMVQ